MDSQATKKWFVYIVDHHEGPMTEHELSELVRQGRVSHESYVWCDGMADWQLITTIGELSSVLRPTSVSEPVPDVVFQDPPSAADVSVSAAPEAASVDVVEEGATQFVAMEEGSAGVAVAPTGAEVVAAETVEAETAEAEPLQDEKTGDIPVAEQSVLNQIAQPEEKKKRSSKSFWFLLILLFIGAGVLWSQGYLDRYLPPNSRALVQKELIHKLRPALRLAARWVPYIQRWLPSIPQLPGLSATEMEELQTVLFSDPAQGVKVTLVDASSTPSVPEFVIATNVVGRPRFEVYFEGVPDTLLNTTFFGTRVQVATSDGYAVLQPFKQKGAGTIPMGEYNVYVVEEDTQPKEVAEQLQGKRSVSLKLPDFIPPDRKMVSVRKYFLGGEKNTQYESRLKEYHDQLTRQSNAELMELEQFQMTIEMQLASLVENYEKLKSKPAAQKKAAWKRFSAQWLKLQEQINKTIHDWSTGEVQSIFFHYTLYSATRQVNERVLRVREILRAYFEDRNKQAESEKALTSALQEAQDGVRQLKSLVGRSKAFEPTPNGMPKRIE